MQDKYTLADTRYDTLGEFFIAAWEFAHAADAPNNASLAHDQFFAEQDEWRRKLYTDELFREEQAAKGVRAVRG
jgi:hypothetical protein